MSKSSKYKSLEDYEYYGLKDEYVELAEEFLNSSNSLDIIPDTQAIPLFEMFMLGYSFEEINKSYPEISLGKIILTAAIKEWTKSREEMADSLYQRVKSKLIKSTTQQVEFLTDLVSVSNIEVGQEIKNYIIDPVNNPLPSMRIKSLKEYEQVLNMISKLTGIMKDMANQSPQTEEEAEEKVLSQESVLDVLAGKIEE